VDITNQLNQGLQDLKIDLAASTETQLLNYLELLAKWNRVYNLTAVRDKAKMIPKHVLDSLAVLPYVCGTRILDVGTGAGLPGLLLAIARPNWQCVLLDSSAKKIRFVKQAIIELELKNAIAICSRVEKFQPNEKFNTVISRAYASLPLFYTQTAPLCAIDGCLLAMKGTYPETEIAQMSSSPIHFDSFPLQVPQLEAQRHLIVMRPHHSGVSSLNSVEKT